ncbi:hypothetical protein BDR07DRAFT_1488023 [Suillus spraguei]|nr:hypothetical protein BDR07DRAFT_1488023 [Suillus spraguei]
MIVTAAASLAQKFPDQKGGKKTDAACKTKFSSLKSSYNAAVDLRCGVSSSGFTWTDDGGACIDDNSASAWAGYFWNKGFPHFAIFDLLTASNATKGIHVHWVQRNKAASISSNTGGINLCELSVATNEISAGMTSSSAPLSHVPLTSPMGPPASPNAMGPPASPITHLASTSPPSALTTKRSRLPSVTAKAQQDGSAAMSSIATVMQEMNKHLSTPSPAPTTLPAAPPSDFACAVEALTLSTNISKQDKLEMMPLFLKNKDEAIVFLYMDDELRVAWVEMRLGELCAMNID